MLVKICGLNTDAAVHAALAAGADLFGFVFFEKSPRHVDEATARRLICPLEGRKGARAVALSVDREVTALAALLAATGIEMVQLHGGETPAYIERLRQSFSGEVIKVFNPTDADVQGQLEAFAPFVEWFLFDAPPPKGASRPGGHGATFDWQVLEGLSMPRPLLLSGGLNAGNVGAAMAATRPGGVDVSSGVESAPGVKSAEKIAQFVSAARKAEVAGAAPCAGVSP